MTSITRAVVWGGTLCGTLDAAAAMSLFGLQRISPVRVWQGVASGLLGVRAFQSGLSTAALGLLLHYFIAFSAASVFCWAASIWPPILVYPWITGAAYGIVVFLVMNLIVAPLSARPKRPMTRTVTVAMIFIHIVCVGWPIVLCASHFMR